MSNDNLPHGLNGLTAGDQTAAVEDARRFIALPVQLIESAEGAILRRGSTQVMIRGERAMPAIQILLAAMTGEGITIREACDHFAAPDHPAVRQLIEQLLARRFVIPAGQDAGPADPEGPLDVFYWNFGTSTGAVIEQLSQVRVAILGVNHISRQLTNALVTSGVTNVALIDYPFLRNLSFFDGTQFRAPLWKVAVEPLAYEDWLAKLQADSFDCLVATSDFGGLRLMREWNAFCLERDRHFLPVVLQDMVGYIGPSVIPGETACFECFIARLESTRTGHALESALEAQAFAGQQVAGFHPSMASVLGDIAALELMKFYSRALPLWKVGSVMEVNLLAGRIDSRKVLRVPRCRACSPLIRRSSTSIINSSLASKVVEE